MMQRFRNLSLAQKATGLMMGVSLTILMVSLVVGLIQQVHADLGAMREAALTTARVLGYSSEASLSFNDPEAGQQILNAFKRNPSTTYAELFTSEGDSFARYSPIQTDRSDEFRPLLVHRSEGKTFVSLRAIRLVSPITSEGSLIGYLVTETSLERLYHGLAASCLWSGLTLLLAIPVSYALARKVVSPLLAPLVDLSQAMEGITMSQTYHVVVEKQSDDEIGQLVDGFNGMVATVRLRDEELSRQNEILENRVEERTRELRLTNSSSTVAKEAAEASARAKADFLANMSHEIRTPMNGVLGAADLALHAGSQSEQVEYLQVIKSSAESLLGIINDILDFSKIEAGKMVLERTPFNLDEVTGGALAACISTAIRKGVVILPEIQQAVPRRLVGDPVRLRQVLINLIGNSVKFTEAGGGVVFFVDCIRSDDASCELVFAVNDSGIGISADKTAVIFEAFSQADTSLTRKFGGTGLGLSISQSIVRLMGSELNLRSKPGVGTSFSFVASFPLDNTVAPEVADVCQEPEKEILPQRVLIVEDNLVNQKIARQMLVKLGHTVTVASHGQEGVERFWAGDFDVVLMDCQMPVMDGYAATQTIKHDSRYASKSIPIVALTAHAMEGDREKCLEAGMDDYLIKPLTLKSLRDCLSRVVENRESSGAGGDDGS